MAPILAALRTPGKRVWAESGGLGAGWDAQRDRGGWRVAIGRGAPWIGATGVIRRRASGVGGCLPGNALIELELRCGLRQRVPVRQRFEQVIPGGRSAGRAMRGGAAGSAMWLRIRCTGAASLTEATMRMSAPQVGQTSGRDGSGT